MKQFPTLTTARLSLEEVRTSDIPSIIQYAGTEEVARTTLSMPHPYAEKDAIFWINRARQGFQAEDHYIFGIRLAATDEFMGGIGLIVNKRFNKAEIGYWIGLPFWGKGYMTEATAAILKFGFNELGLNKIYAQFLAENPASGKIMIKNGMIKEAELVDHIQKYGEYKTSIQYRLTKAEYENLAL